MTEAILCDVPPQRVWVDDLVEFFFFAPFRRLRSISLERENERGGLDERWGKQT